MNFSQKTNLGRREFVRVGSLAIGGMSLGSFFRIKSAQAQQAQGKKFIGTAKNVIQIVCAGGIAAQESWNPKPEAPLEYRGPFGVCKTVLPGINLSENMKQCSKVLDKMCLVRSVVGSVPEHGIAMYHMLSGNRSSNAIEHPSVGSVVSHEFGPRNGLPAYISVPRFDLRGSGTGYLSPKYGAFAVGGDPANKSFEVKDMMLPRGLDSKMFEQRKSLREIVNNQFRQMESDRTALDAMDSFYDQAYTMISSEKVRAAFDLSKESNATKKAYGIDKYLERGTYGRSYGSEAGMRMLLARRLVEAGARFVTLTYNAWDTHTLIREAYQSQMPALDNALAALITDLDQRGMLDETLVWVASEFGRTPKINASAGRDHWSRVFSIALAGGGLKRGLVYGDSDATSTDPAKDVVPLEDLHATMYRLMGIDSNKELMAPGERPIEIVDGGKVVQDLIA